MDECPTTQNDLRAYLKSKGWKREDHAIGPNKSEELWVPPWLDAYGYCPAGVSLKAALRRQTKVDNGTS